MLLVPLALAGVSQVWLRPGMERDLTARSTAALGSAGLTDATVSFHGRDATLIGVPAGEEQRALAIVDGVDGVRVAVIGTVARSPETVDLTLDDEQLVLHGKVPDEPTRKAVLAAVEARADGRQVVDQLAVQPGSSLAGDPAKLGALVAALGSGQGDRSLAWGANGVTIAGTAPSDEDRRAAEAAVRAALGYGIAVDNQLAVTPAATTPPEPTAPPAPTAPPVAAEPPVAEPPVSAEPPVAEPPVAGPPVTEPPVDKAAVQAALNAAPAITFLPDSPQLTPEGAAAVHRVAQILAGTRAVVELAGHVALAPGGPENAMRLSEARAATVRDALIAAGVPAANLVPRGYGDTRPKPDPAASRRVEITVL